MNVIYYECKNKFMINIKNNDNKDDFSMQQYLLPF